MRRGFAGRRWTLLLWFVLPGAATVCLVPLSPASSWLLERAPDAFVRWEGHGMPRDPRPHVVLGERLLALGETRPALEQFARAAALGSQDFGLAVALADAMRAAGRYDQAGAQARQLLQAAPQSGRLYRILGQCQLEMGQLSEGLASLEQATRLAPHEPDAWIALAEAHLGIEGFQPETARSWEAGLRQNPSENSLRYGLAETDVGLGRYEDAAALLRHLSEQPVPKTPQARELYARAWAARGTVLHRLQPDAARCAAARQALARALALSPQLPDAHYELGLLQAENGQWEAARQSLETATRLRPYAHPFWYHLARIYQHMGLRKQAKLAETRFLMLVSTFATVNRDSQYLDAHPNDASRRLNFARLLSEREDWDAAALHLSLVLQAHPRDPEALRLLQRVREMRTRASEGTEENPKTRKNENAKSEQSNKDAGNP